MSNELYNEIRRGIICDTREMIKDIRAGEYKLYYQSPTKNKNTLIKYLLNQRLSILDRLKDIPSEHLEELKSYLFMEDEYTHGDYSTSCLMYYINVIDTMIKIEEYNRYKVGKDYNRTRENHYKALEVINKISKVEVDFLDTKNISYQALFRNLEYLNIGDINDAHAFIRLNYDDGKINIKNPTELPDQKYWKELFKNTK